MLTAIAALILEQPPKSLSGHAGALIGDRMFITGGLSERANHDFVGTMWEIDLKKDTWTARAPMKTPRGMAAAAAIGSSVYVAGGFADSGEHLRSVERYDILTRRWVDVAPMKNARTRFCLVASGGHLFAMGGLSGKSERERSVNVNSVEEYDPKTNRWQDAGRLQYARHGFAAASLGGNIYISGGYVGDPMNNSINCELYDPASKTSHPIASLPQARGFHGMLVVNNQLVCFGGRPSGQHPCRYDVVGKRWIDLAGPDIELNRFAAASFGGSITLLGGESDRSIPMVQTYTIR